MKLKCWVCLFNLKVSTQSWVKIVSWQFVSYGCFFFIGWFSRAKTPKRVTQPLPVSQTLTSCQMLPVTVTGSAFDRKIVSVLPVPFCQVLVSLWFLFARASRYGLTVLIHEMVKPTNTLPWNDTLSLGLGESFRRAPNPNLSVSFHGSVSVGLTISWYHTLTTIPWNGVGKRARTLN